MFDYDAESGTIRAYGDVGFYDGFNEVDVMQALDAMGGKDVSFRIQSRGGAIDSGLSVYNLLTDYPGRVEMRVDAQAASIASVILMAGDKITASKNATVMIHDPWVAAIGNARAFRDIADVLDMLGRQVADVYADRTGKPADFWVETMAEEKYFSAEEALEVGLVDELIANKQAPENRVEREPVAVLVAATPEGAERIRAQKAQLDARAIRASKGNRAFVDEFTKRLRKPK